jgi:hypothetical protein
MVQWLVSNFTCILLIKVCCIDMSVFVFFLFSYLALVRALVPTHCEHLG